MEVKFPEFHHARLVAIIETMSRELIDDLPYGTILLDAEGRVSFFSAAERRSSGYSRETLTRSFFTEIAPCMNNPEFRGRIDSALAKGTLNISFNYVGDFSDALRMLNVRVHSASNGGCWIFINRP